MDDGERLDLLPKTRLAASRRSPSGVWSPGESDSDCAWRLGRAATGPALLQTVRPARRPVVLSLRVDAFGGSSPVLWVGVEQVAERWEVVEIPSVIDIRTRNPLQGVPGNPWTIWKRTPRNSPDLPRTDELAIEPGGGLLDAVLEVCGETGDWVEVEVWALLHGSSTLGGTFPTWRTPR